MKVSEWMNEYMNYVIITLSYPHTVWAYTNRLVKILQQSKSLQPLCYIQVPMGRSDTRTLNRNLPLGNQEGLSVYSYCLSVWVCMWMNDKHCPCIFSSFYQHHVEKDKSVINYLNLLMWHWDLTVTLLIWMLFSSHRVYTLKSYTTKPFYFQQKSHFVII